MVISANESSKIVTPESDFTTSRLLVGDFAEAEECLSRGLQEIGIRRFLRFGKLTIHFYPREMSEGGISEIEQRVYRELGMSAGANRSEIHL